MIYGFYFRFFKIFHNKIVSVLFSEIAWFLYLCRFQMKRLFVRQRIVTMDEKEAISILNATYPDVCRRPTFENESVDPKIDLSIVVPIYNYVGLIESNIQSILKQKTKYKFELILVDDGSTDGARDIVLSYKEHPNVKVVLQENQGIGGARNTGIDHAVGKYLMFIDCDDVVSDDLVETLMTCAYQDDCDIVMCAHNLVKERGGQTIEVIPNIYPVRNLLKYKNDDEIMNYAGLPWGKVYKRELFNQVRFFPGYWFEDTIIHFLLFTQCKKFVYVPKVCYEYKWYEKNFSHVQENSTNVKAIDRYWLLLAIIEQYETIGLPFDEQFYTLLIKHLSAYYYRSISGLEEKVIEAAFIMANNLLVRYKPQNRCKLPYMLKVTEKAIMKKDINLWKLASTNQ